LGVIVEAVVVGLIVMLAGTLPWNLLFAANLRYFTAAPWVVPIIAVYLVFYWRYLRGAGPPESTSERRRTGLRANPLPLKVWAWSLIAGGLGIVALVLALRVANRLVVLPQQQLPDLSAIPVATVLSLLLVSAPVAGIVEEAAFRGYMQGPIERRYGLPVAILINGTMFGLMHMDFTLMLWAYYVAVAAIYGTVTSLTNSILPAIVLHASGNIYSSLDLWMRGRAEWQAASTPESLIWRTGVDQSFWVTSAALVIVLAVTIFAYLWLARLSPHSARSKTVNHSE
jgi:membrane protease YdiL (CAAX protease family)